MLAVVLGNLARECLFCFCIVHIWLGQVLICHERDSIYNSQTFNTCLPWAHPNSFGMLASCCEMIVMDIVNPACSFCLPCLTSQMRKLAGVLSVSVRVRELDLGQSRSLLLLHGLENEWDSHTLDSFHARKEPGCWTAMHNTAAKLLRLWQNSNAN